jgi:hypothetical protein
MQRTMKSLASSVIVLAVALTAAVPPAWAQAPAAAAASPANVTVAPSSPSTRPAGRAWRVTFRAGGGLVNQPSSGAAALPAPGLPQTILPGFTTRLVPSWYFGDGASILNNSILNGIFPTFPGKRPIVPLDTVLTGASIVRRNGATFGATASRALGSRYRLDVSIDAVRSAPTFSSSALAAIEASRASFTDAWNSFVILQGLTVTSVATINRGGSVEWLATGAIDITLRSTGQSTWYATIGGGVASDPGATPSATLVGHYVFVTGPSAAAPFDETDTVTIESVRAARPVALLGGGWTHDLSRRWGLNADVRMVLGGNGVKTVLDATPTRVLQSDRSLQLIVLIPPNPAIVFSNIRFAAPPFVSTLSGVPVGGFTTFAGGGLQIQTQVTAGLFLKF